MENVFITLLNLSITASYLIIAVILLRFALFKAPKWINCLLWAVVGIRLVLPFSLESILSLIPSAEPIPQDIALSPAPQVNTGIQYVNSAINPIISTTFAPDPTASINPLQIIIPIAAIVWLCGIVAMLLWGAISYLRLKRKVAPSLCLHDNVFLCDNISSPFILGIFKPRVYLPSSISESDAAHVIAHEKAHIARKDFIWKPLGFLILSVYWFNPLCWIAYILFCRDVEKACDERVISKMAIDCRREYSSALLSFSAKRFAVSACPLAFGEVGVKSRIKSILNYKKPAFWIIIVALVAAIAVAVTFLTMPPSDLADDIVQNLGNTDTDKMSEKQKELYEKYPEYFGLDATNGLDVYVWQLAEHNYNFGLKPHSDTPLGFISMELMSLKSASAYDMRLILQTYDISRDEITIVPWQNPISSYIGDIWLIKEGEDAVKERMEYIESIEYMLFDKVYLDPEGLTGYVPSYPYYDAMTFDVDGDGVLEVCTLEHGHTSGLFTFVFNADYPVGNRKYSTVFNSMWYDLSFKLCDDGIVRVQGIDQQGNVHLFDISVSDGKIKLTCGGVPITEYYVMPIIDQNSTATLDYPYYETMTFDVDGDGVVEVCTLEYGRTSGLFTFIFNVDDLLGNEKYSTAFYSIVYDLSFKLCDDGVVRVQGIDQLGEVHLYDIKVKGGEIWLYNEDGQYIGDELLSPIQPQNITYRVEPHIDFDQKDYSSVNKILITDGITGRKVEITRKEGISEIVKSVKTIEGEDPISNKGFYGVRYNVELYCDDEVCLSFALYSDYEGASLIYGLYEMAGGNNYPCRYTLTNCSYEDIASVLSSFFPDN